MVALLRRSFLLLATFWFVNQLYAEKLIFIHTNDSHGYFYPRKEAKGMVHGPLALYAWLAEIRTEAAKSGAHVIVTHGGDVNTGTPESNHLDGAPDIELMNQLGFQVAVLGNHEFDFPLEKLKRQMLASEFRWISANVYLKTNDSKQRITTPVASIETGTVRIGFLGLTTQSTEKIGNPDYLKNIEFTSVIDETRALLPQMKKKHDMVIALTHLGYYPSEKERPMPYHGDIALANAFPEIDLILGGHSHTLVMGDVVNNVPIYQAECYNRYAIRVDVELNKGQKPKVISHSLVRLDSYPPSWEELKKNDYHRSAYLRAETVVKNALRKTEAVFSQVIAESKGDFLHDRKDLFRRSMPIGNLLADAQRYFAKTDIAIVNSGGIRAGLSRGAISVRDVLTISPFNNSLGVLELSGSEIEALFADLLARAPDGHFPQVSGIEIHFNRDSGKVRLYLPKGRLKPEKKYSIAMNSYIAAGGNAYPDYAAQGIFRDLGRSDAEVLTDYLRQQKIIDPADYSEKRIRFFRYRK